MSELSFQFKYKISQMIELKATVRHDFNSDQITLALFGPSGCGKTTLLKLILGLLKSPSGQIKFGSEVWQDHDYFVPTYQRQIGFVPQKECLFSFLDVQRNIGYALKQLSQHERESRINELLKLFQIEDLKTRKISEISGGQKQRVSLARAIAHRPQLLLLDEAFTNLDFKSRQTLLPELADWLREMKIPTILISHDEKDAQLFSSHVFEFQNHHLQI